MGFCGTLGAREYVEYLIADRTVVPAECERFYDERLVTLPHCYFVNDHRQSSRDVLDPACHPSRAALGLPEGRVVFANFNQVRSANF
jgi:protein O-GlcNAc transferase